jgi:hypothetical protein
MKTASIGKDSRPDGDHANRASGNSRPVRLIASTRLGQPRVSHAGAGHPPAIAPTTSNGSTPEETSSGSSASGGGVREILPAGEESHKRPPFDGDVVPNRAAQPRVSFGAPGTDAGPPSAAAGCQRQFRAASITHPGWSWSLQHRAGRILAVQSWQTGSSARRRGLDQGKVSDSPSFRRKVA